MKHLYFLRHGQSASNIHNIYDGVSDTPLTDHGRGQAKKAGQDALSNKLHVDVIVCSPLERAKETAEIFATQVGYPLDKIIVDKRMVERNFGKLQGQTRPGSRPEYATLKHHDVEDDDEIVERARTVLDWLETLPHDDIMVVSHGSFGRAMRSLVHKDFPMSHPHSLPNAEIQEWL
ncbi:MAG TPA: histidine phosphatase family protein [Verrucomicrobiae bacterium]|nr:histidine phosphatase family protein [Verrucomicrobiae bacterium]